MTYMTIGQLARDAGVAESTVRYYEKEGVLARARRSQAGYRRYDESDVERLRLVLRAKALGFTLTEIRDVVGAGRRGGAAEILAAAKRRRELVAVEAAQLAQLGRLLEQLVSVCSIPDASQCEALEVPALPAHVGIGDSSSRTRLESTDAEDGGFCSGSGCLLGIAERAPA
jgi:DNA-binding transcriptional MerR regulator